jgi:hypothetical protein
MSYVKDAIDVHQKMLAVVVGRCGRRRVGIEQAEVGLDAGGVPEAGRIDYEGAARIAGRASQYARKR